MKTLLIIYPQWVPSNNVGVQRVRLIVNFLEEFGWQPIVLTVKPEYYEGEKSNDLIRLVKPGVQVEYVDARKVDRFRLYGDIALRAYSNLKKKAIEIINRQKIDFIWVSIAPFYSALIGRAVHKATGVPYAIDFQDPWVHDFPGSHKLFSRARLASVVANFLEPIAVKNAAVLTGVSESYYLPVITRNPHLKKNPHCAMPFGFDLEDYKKKPEDIALLWDETPDVIPYLYAGAFLPKAHYYIEKLFQRIAKMRNSVTWDNRIRFYFVGTGYTNLDCIADYAKKYDINDIVLEKQERISYLKVLNHLSNAEGILAIGSTEEHYTASKIYQSLLSERPVFAVFHHKSTVVKILKDASADNYLVKYNENETLKFEKDFSDVFDSFINLKKGWSPQLSKLDKYAARNSSKALAKVLNQSLEYS